MARGKVQMKKIENPVHRQVTFCKRRTGLFKKAKELSVLCDAEIGVFIHSSQGKLFELSTKGYSFFSLIHSTNFFLLCYYIYYCAIKLTAYLIREHNSIMYYIYYCYKMIYLFNS